jgi:hypothetical protein
MEGASQREIDPDKWDATRQQAKGNTHEARQLNSFLDSLRSQVYEAQRDILNRGEEIIAQGLKNILYGINVGKAVISIITLAVFESVRRHPGQA